MGNAATKKKLELKGNLGSVLDKIATNYITTQNFQDLAKLENQDYCNKLVVLTSQIFDEYLDSQEIEYLAQRTHLGQVIDKMAKGKVHYTAKKDLPKLDVRNRVRKRRLCIGISKFYIKIGHIFAAILKTINPEYSYKDQFGKRHRISILDKGKMPANFHHNTNVKIPMAKKKGTSFCQHRLDALTPVIDRHDGAQALYKVKICDVNNPGAGHHSIGPVQRVVSLGAQVGFPELKSLYMDKFDYRSGRFTGMSEKSKKEFEQDMGGFYKAFTGKSTAPPDLSSFDNIPLMDYHNKAPCQGPDGFLVQQFAYDPASPLYKAYADHLKKMKANATAGQEKLVGILKELFIKKLERGAVRTTRRAPRVATYPQRDWHHDQIAHQAARTAAYGRQRPYARTAAYGRQRQYFTQRAPQRAWQRGGKSARLTQHVVYTLNPKLTHEKLDAIVLETRKLILELYTQCEIDFKAGLQLFEAIIEKKEQEKMAKRHSQLKSQFDNLIQ